MPKTRAQKEATVQNISEKLSKAKAVVFTDYKGLTMKQLSALRKQLREQNAEFAITKNSLLQRAAQSTNRPFGGPLPTTNYSGPTATLFAYDDQISPVKILVKAFKDFTFGKVKSGYLDGEVLDEAKIIQLSTLPTKDELRSKMVGVLVAPLQGMVSVLQGNLRNLVYALNQIKIRRLAEKGGV